MLLIGQSSLPATPPLNALVSGSGRSAHRTERRLLAPFRQLLLVGDAAPVRNGRKETAQGTAPSVPGERFMERVAKLALAASADDGGALVERLATAAGSMPPLHARDEDESYYLLTGEITFFVGEEVVQAAGGDVVLAPRSVPRTFRVESEHARWLVLTRVTSLARFEDFGRALTRPHPGGDWTSWPSDEEIATLRAIAATNGIEVLGPPGLLPGDLHSAAPSAP